MAEFDEAYLSKLRNTFDYDLHLGRLLLKGTNIDNSTETSRGYRKLQFQGKGYLLHRLIYFYHEGYFPNIVDHVDGNVLNNAMDNLQSCTQQENIEKAKIFKTNTTGFKGVSYNKNANKYESYFFKNYAKIYCGLWNTPKEAFEARQQHKRRILER